MIDRLDIEKTKYRKRLVLTSPWYVKLVDSLFHTMFSGIGIALLIAIFTNAGGLLGFNVAFLGHLIIPCIILNGVLFYLPERRLKKVILVDKRSFQNEMAKYLNEIGWWVIKNNRNYMYAYKSRGRLDYEYYAIFSDDNVYINFLVPLPFPLSLYYENTFTNMACNKALQSTASGSD